MNDSSRLSGYIQPPGELTPNQRLQMFTLLADYFINVTPAQFEEDLAEKEWVIVLCDTVTGLIRGFSTLMRLCITVNAHPVVAFFSGDTIIQRDYWGEVELPRIWGNHVFTLAATIQHARVFWFLISSGYKTYRFLPVFFNEFYPNYQKQTPPEFKQILNALACLKFPNQYDANRGLIHLAHAAPLRPEVAEVTARRLRDPHVAFFTQANPGHAQGDQLACLVELTHTNLTPAGRRMLGLA